MRDNRILYISIGVMAAILIGGYYVLLWERDRQLAIQQEVAAPIDLGEAVLEEKSTGEVEVSLFFYGGGGDPSKEDFLRKEERRVFNLDDPELMARQIVREVLKGSASGRLEAEPPQDGPKLVPLAEAVRLRQLYLMENGTALVDLSIEKVRGMVEGITSELAVVESITRSLKENVPEVRRVQFLVDGKQEATLAGHVSIRRPFM